MLRWFSRVYVKKNSWTILPKLVTRLHATAALWVRIQTFSIVNGWHKQRSSRNTLVRQKIWKKRFFTTAGFRKTKEAFSFLTLFWRLQVIKFDNAFLFGLANFGTSDLPLWCGRLKIWVKTQLRPQFTNKLWIEPNSVGTLLLFRIPAMWKSRVGKLLSSSLFCTGPFFR